VHALEIQLGGEQAVRRRPAGAGLEPGIVELLVAAGARRGRGRRPVAPEGVVAIEPVLVEDAPDGPAPLAAELPLRPALDEPGRDGKR
jgi:hypothetical protein